ncbi:MAG: hypothetical protein JJE25_13110, partial [Bacteroidia bacterium]|nr:hypothetical protein [Bacteroidia bacterium]
MPPGHQDTKKAQRKNLNGTAAENLLQVLQIIFFPILAHPKFLLMSFPSQAFFDTPSETRVVVERERERERENNSLPTFLSKAKPGAPLFTPGSPKGIRNRSGWFTNCHGLFTKD